MKKNKKSFLKSMSLITKITLVVLILIILVSIIGISNLVLAGKNATGAVSSAASWALFFAIIMGVSAIAFYIGVFALSLHFDKSKDLNRKAQNMIIIFLLFLPFLYFMFNFYALK